MEQHEHSQPHGVPHPQNFSSANKDFFNEIAPQYNDKPEAVEGARRITSAMRRTYPLLFDEENTILMDYACGTGLISRELCPYVKSIVGVDISSASVDLFNHHANNQGLAPEEMKAVCVELEGSEQELEGQKFDVVVCASAYHHFSSVEDVTRVLTFFLKPGGSLVIADVMKNVAGSEMFPKNTHHVVAHPRGFDEAGLRNIFEGAGLTEFHFTPAFLAKLHGTQTQVFLARGVKPLSPIAAE
ncbi:hypothetical protein AcW1_001169 [Taiwanofungus camphoratus]|nr:hypothetical protein AcW1_001169 [Antrodia cinnamomea]